MTRCQITLMTLMFLSCSPSNSNNQETQPEITLLTLTETELGNLKLDHLNEKNLISEIKTEFPDFQITKKVGQQDGPDYNLYEIRKSEKEVFFLAMNTDDTNKVQHLWTKNQFIKDQYGVAIGQKIEIANEKRPNLEFHSDLHFNIYATEKNSKIEYRLTGDFITLNDSAPVAKDFSVKKWQIPEMTVEYIIWRK